MVTDSPSLRVAVWKSAVVHTVTYFILGVISFVAFEYRSVFGDPLISQFFRSSDDPMVMAGPMFQPIRGVLLGVLVYLLREPLFHARNGWLVLWVMLVVVGILSPYVGAPGSLEGLVYTRMPVSFQLSLLPEVLVQTLFYSALLVHWVHHPEKRWLSWTLGVACFFMVFLPALGLLAPRPA